MKKAKTRLCLTRRCRTQHGLAMGQSFEKYIGARAAKVALIETP